jgi:hypothetical protein
VERCLACEAVVNREPSSPDALTLAALYGFAYPDPIASA